MIKITLRWTSDCKDLHLFPALWRACVQENIWLHHGTISLRVTKKSIAIFRQEIWDYFSANFSRQIMYSFTYSFYYLDINVFHGPSKCWLPEKFLFFLNSIWRLSWWGIPIIVVNKVPFLSRFSYINVFSQTVFLMDLTKFAREEFYGESQNVYSRLPTFENSHKVKQSSVLAKYWNLIIHKILQRSKPLKYFKSNKRVLGTFQSSGKSLFKFLRHVIEIKLLNFGHEFVKFNHTCLKTLWRHLSRIKSVRITS